MKYRIILLALAACILSYQAHAQYRVVASCPAVTDFQPSGSSGGSPVVDTKGNLCAGGTSGSTANQGTPGSINSGWPTIGGELSPDASGTFTNATQTISITQVNVDGYGTAMVSINGTYGTGTGVFELSDDGGTTWYPVQGSRIDSCIVELGYTGLTNTNRVWTIPISGADQIRVRSTAVASGTINVRISVSSAVPPSSTSICGTVTVVGPTADGSTSANSPPVLMGGTSDGTGTGTADVAKVDTGGNTYVLLASQYPSIAVPLTVTATGTTAATTATLAGTAAKTTYICGFTISADATTAVAGNATVTGTISGSLNFIQNVGAATAAGMLTQTFSPCIPASGQNVGIAVNSAAAGIAGNTAVNAWGYQL